MSESSNHMDIMDEIENYGNFGVVPAQQEENLISERQIQDNIAMIESMNDENLENCLFQLKEKTDSCLGHASVVKALLKRMKDFWTCKTDYKGYLEWCHKRFKYDDGIEESQITTNLLDILWKKKLDHQQLIVAAQREMYNYKSNFDSEDSEEGRYLSQCFNGLNACYDALQSYYNSLLNNQGKIVACNPRFEVWKHSLPSLNASKMKPKTQLIIYLLGIAHQKGYKRYRKDVYKPIYSKQFGMKKLASEWLETMDRYGTPLAVQQLKAHRETFDKKCEEHNLTFEQGIVKLKQGEWSNEEWVIIFEKGGNNTYSYERVCSIEEFVHENVQAEDNFHQWSNLVEKQNAKQVVEHLQICDSTQFKDITHLRSRYIFAYAQGLYFANEDQFYCYDNPQLGTKNFVACRYFDQLFPCWKINRDQWENLETPLFDSIFTYQKLPRDVIRMIYVLGGRLIYPVGFMDNWQIAPFFKGIAGSGKSTVAKIFSNFFEQADVGYINSTGEVIFSLMSIYDKYAVFATEVKKNFNFPQDLLQQCVSNDPVNVAVKHGSAKMIRWTAPLLFCGNETPNWQDAQGSMRRRIVCILFEQFVKEADKKPQFEATILNDELPILIRKCNQAYLQTVAEHYNEDIWKFLPEYFKKAADDLQSQINPVISFLLRSGKIRFDEKEIVSFDDFNTSLKDYCISNGFGKFQMTSDAYKSIFDAHDLKVVEENREYNGRLRLQKYILGIKLNRDDEDNDSSDDEDNSKHKNNPNN